jgi:hypothetical protein
MKGGVGTRLPPFFTTLRRINQRVRQTGHRPGSETRFHPQLKNTQARDGAQQPRKAAFSMQDAHHQFSDLFAQLGLPNDPAGIAQFIQQHRPLAGEVTLPDAPFWTPAQATFLKEALIQDSDWAELADQLSEALRGDETPPA